MIPYYKRALYADDPLSAAVVATTDPKEPAQTEAENGPEANDGTGGLKQAYDRGADKAKLRFLKDEYGSRAPTLSNIPVVGPLAAGLAAAHEAPKGSKRDAGFIAAGGASAGLGAGWALSKLLDIPVNKYLKDTPIPLHNEVQIVLNALTGNKHLKDTSIPSALNDLTSKLPGAIGVPNSAVVISTVANIILQGLGSYYGTQLAQHLSRKYSKKDIRYAK